MSRPKGILVLAFLHGMMALWVGFGAVVALLDPWSTTTGVLASVFAVLWLCVGPLLLLRRPASLAVARFSASALIFAVASSAIYSCARTGMWSPSLWALLLIAVFVYLIGVRGYLYQDHVAAHFHTPPQRESGA